MGEGEKTLLLRFNLNRKTDREIWEWLHEKSESQTLSMNAFLIEGERRRRQTKSRWMYAPWQRNSAGRCVPSGFLCFRRARARNPRWRQMRRSLPTFWISPTAFDAFKMIAHSFGGAFNLKVWIDGAEEAAIRRRGTGENAVSPVLSAEPTMNGTLQPVDESTIVGYYTSAEVIPGTQTGLKPKKRRRCPWQETTAWIAPSQEIAI